MDLVRLSVRPGQVEHFKHDLNRPNFVPVQTPSAVASNNWRRKIVMQEGCLALSWGTWDQPASYTAILLICKLPF